MNGARANRTPVKPLLALAAVVLAAHALLLRVSPASVQPPDPLHARPLATRTIAITAAPVALPAVFHPAPAPRRESSVRPAAAVRPRQQLADTHVPEQQATTAPAPADLPPAPAAEVVAAALPQPAAPQPTAFVIAAPMRLQYKVEAQLRGQSWQAASELVWRHDGDSYEAKLEVSAPLLPTRTQRSTGRITAEGLAPLRFSDKGRSEEAAHFERDKGKVSFSSNRPDAPLLAGAQDRLSVLLQLGAMIAGEPQKFPPATTISIPTAGTREAEPWLFTVEGDEELTLPGGKLTALKLTRSPRKEFDLKVELWLAPGMDYAPVRLRLTQPNGDSVDQQWASTDRG
ncbi:MAG: hypothetical protein JWQ07_3037 [Ramlibacter sp.]|nr:hypothetical protein [Ramlibacter sp.]